MKFFIINVSHCNCWILPLIRSWEKFQIFFSVLKRWITTKQKCLNWEEMYIFLCLPREFYFCLVFFYYLFVLFHCFFSFLLSICLSLFFFFFFFFVWGKSHNEFHEIYKHRYSLHERLDKERQTIKWKVQLLNGLHPSREQVKHFVVAAFAFSRSVSELLL